MPFLGAIGQMIKGEPEIPKVKEVLAGVEQAEAVNANIQNIGQLKKLTEETNKLSLDQVMKQLRASIPNFDQLQKQSADVLLSQLQGQIPQDVADEVRRNTAESAVAGGFAGSGFERNLTARDLGLTSMNITNQALDSAQRFIANAKNLLPGTFDFTSMFVTPAQTMQLQQGFNDRQFARQMTKNQIDFEFSNSGIWGNALVNADEFIQELAVSYVGGMAGGGMGGGGGK